MAYFVYILQSDRDGSYYIGHTCNPDERLERHNGGRSQYTKSKMPWRLVYQEIFETRSQAAKREVQLKANKDREYIASLVRASR
jgi:putative endonuclease